MKDIKEILVLSSINNKKVSPKKTLLNGTQRDFIYQGICMNKGEYELDLIDDKNKYFELDYLIVNCFSIYILFIEKAKNNEDIIRLYCLLLYYHYNVVYFQLQKMTIFFKRT